MNEFEPTRSHSQERDQWLSEEGLVLYNALGDQITTILESGNKPLSRLQRPQGTLDQAALIMGSVVDELSEHVETIVAQTNPQGALDFSTADRARYYMSPEAPGQDDPNSTNVMLVEGISTNFVMSAKFTLLALKLSGENEGFTPEDVADAMNTRATRSLLTSASMAGQAFWGPFSGKDAVSDEDESTFDIEYIEEDFVSRFNGHSEIDIDSLDQLLSYNPEKGAAFTELAKQVMQKYREDYNEREEPEWRTGNCPVTRGRLPLKEDSQLVFDIESGNLGPNAQEATTVGEPVIEEGDLVGYGATVAFDPLIPRLNHYFAEVIREL